MSSVFGVELLFHQKIRLYHEVVVQRNADLQSFLHAGVNDRGILELVQHLRYFADTDDFILKLPHHRVVEDQVTLYFVVQDWIKHKFDVRRRVLLNFYCFVVHKKVHQLLFQ